jgi:hypothetical protein
MTNLNNAKLITAQQYSHAVNWMKMKGFLPTDFRIIFYNEGSCVGGNSAISILWRESGEAFLVEPCNDSDKKCLFLDEDNRTVIGRPLHLTKRENLNIDLNMFDKNENTNQKKIR